MTTSRIALALSTSMFLALAAPSFAAQDGTYVGTVDTPLRQPSCSFPTTITLLLKGQQLTIQFIKPTADVPLVGTHFDKTVIRSERSPIRYTGNVIGDQIVGTYQLTANHNGVRNDHESCEGAFTATLQPPQPAPER